MIPLSSWGAGPPRRSEQVNVTLPGRSGPVKADIVSAFRTAQQPYLPAVETAHAFVKPTVRSKRYDVDILRRCMSRNQGGCDEEKGRSHAFNSPIQHQRATL